MKRLWLFFALVISSSCSDKVEISRQYYHLQRDTEAYNECFYRFMNYWYELKESSEDKSAPDFQKRVIELFDVAKEISDSLIQINVSIENLKEKMLEEAGIFYEKHHLLEKDGLSCTKKKHVWTNPQVSLEADYGEELDAIGRRLTKIRAWALKHICSYHTAMSNRMRFDNEKIRSFHFYDPKLAHFDTVTYLSPKLNKAVEKAAPDDSEAFKHFYIRLSKGNIFLDEDVNFLQEDQSLLNTLSLLTKTQTIIMAATSDLTALLRSNIGCGADYGFDRIFVNVDGPEAVVEGDSVELCLFYSFYDSDKTPIIKLTSPTSENIRLEEKAGQAFVRFTAKESQKLSGTLTILNKSGIPKTMEWEKTIRVLKKH